MKTYVFQGVVVLESPLHLGSGESGEYVDSLVLRDGDGQPFISGTSLCGLMASLARDRLRLARSKLEELDEEPVFRALFGAEREEKRGRESRLVVLNAPCLDPQGTRTFIQDRTSVDRERGSAAQDHLFHDEVVAAASRFRFFCEFREKASVLDEDVLAQVGQGANAEAFALLLDILDRLEKGWCALGGKTGTGHGDIRLDALQCGVMDRSDAEDVEVFALERPEVLVQKRPVDIPALRAQTTGTALCIPTPAQDPSVPEMLVIRGMLRPLDPFLVKAGYTTEMVPLQESQRETTPLLPYRPVPKCDAVDAAFCRNDQGLAYLPGSSIRGALRSHAERMIRTLIYTRDHDDQACRAAAWDLKELQRQGRAFAESEAGNDFQQVYTNSCLVSRLFGFSALGGRIRFRDAFPQDSSRFQKGLKLLDHVAIDRFTGGAADKRKYNSRPFFPSYPAGTGGMPGALPDDAGDLKFQIEISDFEPWHLGLVALLLKDLHLAKIYFGYGKAKGFGRMLLVPGSIEIEALTHPKGLLAPLIPEKAETIGGFSYVPTRKIKPAGQFWLSPEEGQLYEMIKKSVEAFQEQIVQWRFTATAEGVVS